MTIQQQVREFHTAFGLPARAEPGPVEDDLVRKSVRLIAEEFVELLGACFSMRAFELLDVTDAIEAVVNGTPVDVSLVDAADALADIAYVVESANLSLGINSLSVLDEVHRSNMTKLGADGKPIYRADGKVMKPATWRAPDIAGALYGR